MDFKTENFFQVNEYILDSEVTIKIIDMSIDRKSEQIQNLGQSILKVTWNNMYKVNLVIPSTGDSQWKWNILECLSVNKTANKTNSYRT